MGNPMKSVHDAKFANGVSIGSESEFGKKLSKLIKDFGITKVIETGTFDGMGSSLVIAKALENCESFYSIECNSERVRQAVMNLWAQGFRPNIHCGISLPIEMLPSKEDFEADLLLAVNEDVYIDHPSESAFIEYQKECEIQATDDLIGFCIKQMDYSPDLVLLDSAGHLGFREFQYILGLIKTPCFIALDDTNHFKHYRSLRKIKSDKRFSIVEDGNEKFGYVIAHFKPFLK